MISGIGSHHFLVRNLDNRTNRMDAHFFNPQYYQTLRKLSELTKNGKTVQSLDKLLTNSKTRLTGGATPKGATYLPEGIPFIRVQNVKECKLEIEKAVLIPRIVHERMLKRSQLKPKDVVLTITGSYGISAVVPENIQEANMNQHSVKMETNEEIILPNYLCHFLNSDLCRSQMDRESTGGTRPALDYSAIKSLQILFPKDIDKQNQISKETTRMYEKAYSFLDKRDRILSAINALILNMLRVKLPSEFFSKCFHVEVSRENRLDAIIHSPYREKLIKLIQTIPHKKLGKLVDPVTAKTPPYDDYYKLIDMRNVEERTGRLKVTETGKLGSTKILLEKGQILASRLNPEKGKIFFVDTNLEGCVCSTEFIPLHLVSGEVDLSYLMVILRSKIATDQWKYQVTGSTPSRERISEQDLLHTLIPLPNKSMQKQIGNSVFERIKAVTHLERSSNSLIAKARATFLESLCN